MTLRTNKSVQTILSFPATTLHQKSAPRLEHYTPAAPRYLQSGPEPRHIPPGTTGTAWSFLCTAPSGSVWGPTGSSAQLPSAPAPPPGSSSAGPTPTPRWPCCLQAGRPSGGAERAAAEEFRLKETITGSELSPFLVARYRLSELNAKAETPILGFARSGSGLTTGSWTGNGDSSSGAARSNMKQVVKNPPFFFPGQRQCHTSGMMTHICCGC